MWILLFGFFFFDGGSEKMNHGLMSCGGNDKVMVILCVVSGKVKMDLCMIGVLCG